MLPNIVLPNPLEHFNQALITYQPIKDINNLKLNKNFDKHEYNEIRLKLSSKDLEKDKKLIIGCLKFLYFLNAKTIIKQFTFWKS